MEIISEIKYFEKYIAFHILIWNIKNMKLFPNSKALGEYLGKFPKFFSICQCRRNYCWERTTKIIFEKKRKLKHIGFFKIIGKSPTKRRAISK